MCNKLIILMIAFCAAHAISCSNKPRSKDDLLEYVLNEKNGLSKKINLEGVHVEAYFAPFQLFNSEESGNDYQNNLYFVVVIANAKTSTFDRSLDINLALDYLSANLIDYISFSTNDNLAIPPSDHHLIKSLGLSRGSELLLVVEKDRVRGESLVLNIKEFGLGIGSLNFSFDTDDIDNVLTVKI